jgi:hypothetical protein
MQKVGDNLYYGGGPNYNFTSEIVEMYGIELQI